MKTIPPISGLFVVMTLSLTQPAFAQTKAESATNTAAAYDQSRLFAVGSLADAHLLQTRHTLEVLARTAEVQSGQWERMKLLVSVSVPPTLPQVMWFVQPDGKYYTSAAGMVGQKLSDRAYFPKLIAGEVVCGDLWSVNRRGKSRSSLRCP